MDQSFQHKAYSSLSDHKKRALLKNARLKDECTLQDSGLSNLWSRYNNQETACAAIHLELIELEMQEEKAMENVQHVMRAKAVTTSLIRYADFSQPGHCSISYLTVARDSVCCHIIYTSLEIFISIHFNMTQ